MTKGYSLRDLMFATAVRTAEEAARTSPRPRLQVLPPAVEPVLTAKDLEFDCVRGCFGQLLIPPTFSC